MRGTNADRDRKRAERWVGQSGGITYVPPEAFVLLMRRLAARKRSAVQCIPLVVVAVGIFGATRLNIWSPPTLRGGRTVADGTLAAYAVLAIATVVLNGLIDRAERQIGASLPHRVSRGTAVSIPTMLGRARMTFLICALATEAALGVALLSVHAGWLASTYLVAYVVAGFLVVLGVRQEGTRPTIAMDESSLAIDERLRSEDAYSISIVLLLLLFVFPDTTAYSPGWLNQVWDLGGVALAGLWVLGLSRRPWRPLRREKLA